MHPRTLKLILIVPALLLLCTKCYCLFNNGTDSTIVFDENPKLEPLAKLPSPSSRVSNAALHRHPWLVSVHVMGYKGNMYKCPGIVMNETRIMASQFCNITEKMVVRTRVRSQSIYYNKGGHEHKCLKLTSHYEDNVIYLDVEPPFPYRLVPNPKPIISYGVKSWTYATDVSWVHFPKDTPFRERVWSHSDTTEKWNASICKTYNNATDLKFMIMECNRVLSTRMGDRALCEMHEIFILEDIPVDFSLPPCEE